MINVSSVMNALYLQVASAQTVVDSNIIVELNSVINQDPNRMPWVGLFHDQVEITPRRLQRPNPWEFTYRPSIIIEVGNFGFNESEMEASNRLDETLDVVFTAIDSIRTFVNCVYMITDYTVTPFRFSNDQDQAIYAYEMRMGITKRIS